MRDNALTAVAVAVFVALVVATGATAAPSAEISQASGQLALDSSVGGGAVFASKGMVPGDTATGSVTLTNSGSRGGSLRMEPPQLEDRPGPFGGRLSDVLQVNVEDATDPAAVRSLYSGRLADLGRLALGDLAAGQQMTLRFTVTFPDGGAPSSETTGDNALRGSAVTARLTWVATEAQDADGGPGDDGQGDVLGEQESSGPRSVTDSPPGDSGPGVAADGDESDDGSVAAETDGGALPFTGLALAGLALLGLGLFGAGARLRRRL